MRKVAPELDALMWTIVEEGNDRAREEFEQRYPHLRGELLKRSSMVAGLKRARTTADVQDARPPFKVKEPARAAVPKRTMLVAGGLALAALAVASYTATYLLAPKQEPVARQSVKTDPLPRSFEPPQDVKQPPPVAHTPPQHEEQPVASETPAYLKPQDLKIEGAPLTAVLEMIATKAGLRTVIAPGMPDPVIDIDYRGLNSIQMFQDLGKEYKFTAFDQGNGSVIFIPAVENDVNRVRLGG